MQHPILKVVEGANEPQTDSGLDTLREVFEVIDRRIGNIPITDAYLAELQSYHALFRPLAEQARRQFA